MKNYLLKILYRSWISFSVLSFSGSLIWIIFSISISTNTELNLKHFIFEDDPYLVGGLGAFWTLPSVIFYLIFEENYRKYLKHIMFLLPLLVLMVFLLTIAFTPVDTYSDGGEEFAKLFAIELFIFELFAYLLLFYRPSNKKFILITLLGIIYFIFLGLSCIL